MAKKKNKGARPADRHEPAVVRDWERYMGAGELPDWQRLMEDLGFEAEFTSKNQCRKVLKTVWVNIPDFLDAVKKHRPVHHFENQRELADYTIERRRFYPKCAIKKDSPLRQLLAHILVNRGRKGHGANALAVQMGGLSLLGM
ncbi:hypothetical protein F4802DRAFT_446412 [Xylaria palmicola]|nr:hypothetical protein F4802DRAFT_446412 [Xylaria palmicola]